MRIIISFIFYFLIIFPHHIILADEFVMLKNNKVNVRYGPSFDYPIKYIYLKQNLPIKIIDKTRKQSGRYCISNFFWSVNPKRLQGSQKRINSNVRFQ